MVVHACFVVTSSTYTIDYSWLTTQLLGRDAWLCYPPWALPGANTTLTTSTIIRYMLVESNNVPTDKLLHSGLTPDIYWTSFGSNLTCS